MPISIAWNNWELLQWNDRLCPISIYTLSDLGVLSNLIGSLSLANEHYSPPTEWKMHKPNKNKMAGVNTRFASVSESEIIKNKKMHYLRTKRPRNLEWKIFHVQRFCKKFRNLRMLCTACTFSTHELRGQLNRFLMVSFWKCCGDHFLCIC